MDGKKILEDIQAIIKDKALCIRCQGQMMAMPTPANQPHVGLEITVHACVDCGKMEFFVEAEKDGRRARTKRGDAAD